MIMVFLINTFNCGFGRPTVIQNGQILAVGTADAVAFITVTSFPVIIEGCVIESFPSFMTSLPVRAGFCR
jgi:hypothetical protein